MWHRLQEDRVLSEGSLNIIPLVQVMFNYFVSFSQKLNDRGPKRSQSVHSKAESEASHQPEILLGADEIERANEVFKKCDVYNEQHLNKEQFALAIELLGLVKTEEQIKNVFDGKYGKKFTNS